MTDEELDQAFEALRLTPYQARSMVGLLRLGSANCLELARVSGIPRTSTYEVLEELEGRGLAFRLPGPGPAVWASAGHRDVLDRLIALEQERLVQLKGRSDRVREMLDEVLPVDGAVSGLPFVRLIHDSGEVQSYFGQLLEQTQEELLVFSRPPYGETLGLGPVLRETVGRVATRVLSQAVGFGDAGFEAWAWEAAAWQDAGAAGRLVDDLPVRLALSDRSVSLLTLDDPSASAVGGSVGVLVEHPGYTSVLAGVFESMWDSAPVGSVR